MHKDVRAGAIGRGFDFNRLNESLGSNSLKLSQVTFGINTNESQTSSEAPNRAQKARRPQLRKVYTDSPRISCSDPNSEKI